MIDASEFSNANEAGRSVFISYSRSDLHTVRPLAAQLRKIGVQTWVDLEDLRPGERWKNAIDEALASSTAMVYCLSPLTLESAWTSVELKAALNRNMPIIPVMVQPLEIAALPPELQSRQIYDMAKHPAVQAIDMTARDIAKELGLDVAACSLNSDEFDGPQVLVLHFGQLPDIDALVPRMKWVSIAGTQITPWPVRALTASQLLDIEQQLEQASHAMICVSNQTHLPMANLLIGSVAARLGPRRLTIVEDAGGQILKLAADAVSAYHLSIDRT